MTRINRGISSKHPFSLNSNVKDAIGSRIRGELDDAAFKIKQSCSLTLTSTQTLQSFQQNCSILEVIKQA